MSTILLTALLTYLSLSAVVTTFLIALCVVSARADELAGRRP